MTIVYYNDTSDMVKRKKIDELEILQSQNKFYLKLKTDDDEDIVIKLGE